MDVKNQNQKSQNSSAGNDEHHLDAESTPLNSYFKEDSEKLFSTLGRVSIAHEPEFYRNLESDKRRRIQELAKTVADGRSTMPYYEAGLSSSDLLALATTGTQSHSATLDEANQHWWQMRENTALWQTAPAQVKCSFFERLLESHTKRRSQKIIKQLQFDEHENQTLFKTELFSRRTVYTRDYAVIPKRLRSLFKMVPLLIFAPRNREQLCRFMAFAAKKRLKVVPRGRGTWSLGGALATKGGIVLEMASFGKKIEVNVKQHQITVSGSVDFQEAEEALNQHNLTLMIRPSNKYAPISGFLSVGEPFKGGLGLHAYAYGHIRNSVEAIRVVTSTGDERLVKKDSPEFKYFFGTNGRFGIIIEITLRVIPRPRKYHPVALHFSNIKNTFKFINAFQNEVQSGGLHVNPVQIEFYSKSFLSENKKLNKTGSKSVTVNLISPESSKRSTSNKDTVLFVFNIRREKQAFQEYIEKQKNIKIAVESEARELWDERYEPMKLRKKGDILAAEVILPLDTVEDYLIEINKFAAKLGIQMLPVVYLLNSREALILSQFLTDRRHRFQYYRHFSLIPVLARWATKRYGGRPYGYGIWFAGLFRKASGKAIYQELKHAKKRFDKKAILNPGKLTEIRSRLWNLPGKMLLHEWSIVLLELILKLQIHLTKIKKIKFSNKKEAYIRERGDALHRCIKCSACMICPLAQIWERSRDPKLMNDAIYITPRFKMEYMQHHIFHKRRMTQQDVDRFVLCLRCGVAEREAVCPISDLLLEVEHSESTLCQKKLSSYDDFEAQLRKEGYDVDGAIQRYLDILQTHPGVARAMQEVLGNYRVPKTGDLNLLWPKNDFAIYKVIVDEDRCINCGKCGDEHTTSQRGFWDPRNPRKMVSLDDLVRELDGNIPVDWFRDRGGPLPSAFRNQGRCKGGFVHFPFPSVLDTGHQHCNGCLYCVIECPVDAIQVQINDYYLNLAGKDFTHEDIRRINEEARTGEVPTSGTGSTGLFGGKGFDRYMFDFSVIVRPTRDGIREDIDINVNLGRKPLFHLFESANDAAKFPGLKTHFHTLDLPTPILLEFPVLQDHQNIRPWLKVLLRGAESESTLLILNLFQFIENFETIHPFAKSLGLRLLPAEIETIKSWHSTGEVDRLVLENIKKVPLVEIVHDFTVEANNRAWQSQNLKGEFFNRQLVVSNLLICPLDCDPQKIADQAEYLAQSGAEIIHLKTEFNPEKGYYESADILPACYNRLLSKSRHTQVSIISNGIKSPADLGISMMLGASAVVLDRVVLVALNHEYPMLEAKRKPLPEIEPEEGLRRLRNLFQAWHKQIREVLGAFGVRDIRRTVGERGRLIDLREREKKMKTIVKDPNLLQMAKKINREKINEEISLAHAASWKYSELNELVKPVTPPNRHLLAARSASLHSMLAARGDRRWNADMLRASWFMSSGQISSHNVVQTGADLGAGSFDAMTFAPVKLGGKTLSLETAVEEIDRRIKEGDQNLCKAIDSISVSAGVLNRHRRAETAPHVNHFPIDAADMSLGSIGWKLTLARYLAGAVLKRYTGTGEGGYPMERFNRLHPYFPNLSKDEMHWLAQQMEQWVATQTATGYFGVNEDTIRRVRKIVLKFAQGAKPGLGGHILGAKVTSQVEDLRGVIAGISVFSPFPFHDVYSIEDVTKMIEWLRTINPDAIITVKISTPVDVYHVALGLVTGGADEIQIDATAGGTGAAPDIARNRIAMPLEYALADVHKFLVEQGERNKVVLIASGGIRSAYDLAKAIILGADKAVLGTQEIVSQQCNRCGNCEAPGGCQKGITTTVEQLEEQKDIVMNAQWLINSQVAVVQHLMKMMYAWGIKDIQALRGRMDLIENWGWQEQVDRVRVIGEQREVKNSAKAPASIWSPTDEDRHELDACGVVSLACTKAVTVESIQTACQRMQNRGNGRGGGILASGGLFSAVLEDCYALQIITLAPEHQRKRKMWQLAKNQLQDFDIFERNGSSLKSVKLTLARLDRFRNPRQQKDGRDVTWQEAGLYVDPGDLFRFFVRVKKPSLLKFAREILETCRISDAERTILENSHPAEFFQRINIAGKWIDYYVKYFDQLTDDYLDSIQSDSSFWQVPEYEDLWRDLEDEFVYRCAININQKYYIEPQNQSEKPEAFVASMMKDGGIWKLVGFAEQAANYWIIGDAQYIPVAKLNKLIKEEFKNEQLVLSQLKSKKNVQWRLNKGQLEIEINRSNNRKLSIIVPNYGKQAVVVFGDRAHVWIGHQRFPTVFSPFSGGSHPFYGRIYEALIHNGDFANYRAMVRFWDQFGGAPQFRTDTEMAAKAYAILKQMGYPLPHIIEAIAPTSGIDLQRLYQANPDLAADFEAIQKSHIAGSPDGPWFFIISDQDAVTRDLRVIGLTDTSVLRPSVFIWQHSSNGKWASIGLVGSEEQACRSVLDSLHQAGVLATKEPDEVKIVRGGSIEQEKEGDVSGGGAIVYNLKRQHRDKYDFQVMDKFGNLINRENGKHYDCKSQLIFDSDEVSSLATEIFSVNGHLRFKRAEQLYRFVKKNLKNWQYNTGRWFIEALGNFAKTDDQLTLVIEALTMLKDRMSGMEVGNSEIRKKRASLVQIIADELNNIFDHLELLNSGSSDRKYFRLIYSLQDKITPCLEHDKIIVVDASGFPPQGHDSLARTLVRAHSQGWRKFILYKITGQRYLGVGLGPHAYDVDIHLYGSPGQDIANSMMGGKMYVHADAQNDMAKIIHSGTVVVHGLAGSTGIYGAKGGEIFVRGSVGTRWVINSVSSPTGPGLKVVIVGSAMEYLAESLMGGMVLMLGLEWDENGALRRKYLPFPGNRILAGASAGKVIIYDPDNRVEKEQYAGAVDIGFLSRDWLAVYKNLTNLVKQNFSRAVWIQYMESWHTTAKMNLKFDDWLLSEKQEAMDLLIGLLKGILDTETDFKKLREEAQILKSMVEEHLTGKEWRTLVRLLSQLLLAPAWKEGLELLERMMDWKEVTELLKKADKYFDLGLAFENGWLYLPINGEKTEVKSEDFKVLRPLKPTEKQQFAQSITAAVEGLEVVGE